MKGPAVWLVSINRHVRKNQPNGGVPPFLSDRQKRETIRVFETCSADQPSLRPTARRLRCRRARFFVCTVKAARSIWGFYPTTLADVCRQLRIPLRHHDAESDAQACARILLAARERGHEYHHVLKTCALKAARR